MSSRALTQHEYDLVKTQFNKARDKLIFVLTHKTGYRITEALSLLIKDVLSATIKVSRKNMKGKIQSREVVVNLELRNAINDYLFELKDYDTNAPLFESRQGGPITRQMAHMILKEAYGKAGLSGNGLSTHSGRKSFAKNIYKKSGNDIVLTQKALGHSDISTTVKYLNVFQDEINSLILD